MQKTDREVLTVILLGGVIAASIDIAAASIISGRSPGFILQFIAGGLLGKSSLGGGMGTVTLGAILQEAMGILIATIYVMASKLLPGLRRGWILGGLAYGVAIFFVMNYAVLPLSAWKMTPHFTSVKFAENMAAMLLFGLIVAFFGSRIGVRAETTSNQAATAV